MFLVTHLIKKKSFTGLEKAAQFIDCHTSIGKMKSKYYLLILLYPTPNVDKNYLRKPTFVISTNTFLLTY